MIDVFYWSQIQLPFKYSIDKRMLLKDGVVLEIKCNLVGESARTTPSVKRLVKFDKTFIAHKLANLLEPIKEADKNLIANLMQEALLVMANKEDGLDLTEEVVSTKDDNDAPIPF